MAWSIRQFESRVIQPDVRLNGSRGLILVDDKSEHPAVQPKLERLVAQISGLPGIPDRQRADGSMKRTITRRHSDLKRYANTSKYDAGSVRRGLIGWISDVDKGLRIPTMSSNRPSTDRMLRSRIPHVSPLL